jgi:anaerobic magnesium-protoporphyrin IX monomethyl ester cyclase
MTVLLANSPTRLSLPNGHEQFFVKAGSRWPFSIEKAPSETCRYVPFPFSLGYVAAMLERDKVPVEVFDGVALNADMGTFLQRCAAYRPSIILMEATTPTIEHDLELCRRLKELTGATIVLAGAHPTTFAEELVRDNPQVDWVLKGEYDLNAVAAIHAFRGDPAGREERLAKVPGLVHAITTKDGKRQVVVGPKGTPIHDLDALPFPARHMFPTRQAPSMWPYWDGFCQRRPAIQMHASRGCPYRCTFCLWISVIYEQGPYRTFSARRIVDEMEHVVQTYGAREVYFDDDIFTVKQDHVIGLCDEIRARGLNVNWSVMGDAMAVTEKSVAAMAAAGCIGMKFGLESANSDVLKKLRKPVKIDKVREVVRWCSTRGIKTHATVTFGLEADTPATMQETLDYVCGLPVDSIQFSVTTPFPGTEHHQRASAAGLIVATRWEQYDGGRSSVIKFENMSPEFVADFARKAPSIWLRARLLDPDWSRRQLGYMKSIAMDQGLTGLSRRVRRGVGLLFGQRN